MDPADYQDWLAGGTEGSMASQGEQLFQKYACNTCHPPSTYAAAPPFESHGLPDPNGNSYPPLIAAR